jgi:3-deoxy-D-manno-octulosonic-acid transferase
MIRNLLARFNCVLVQSEEDGKRFEQLGSCKSEYYGNLKYDADLLPCNESELFALQSSISGRPVWVAASTHPGEELMIAETHALLAVMRPNLLTVIVPRHPARGSQIALELKGRGKLALRSRKDSLTPDISFYIADTLGELGLFYRLSELVCMGGSFISHGGQNPLEAARLSCAIVTGPHTQNFTDIYQGLLAEHACIQVESAKALASTIDMMLSNAGKRASMGKRAKDWVEEQSGATDRILDSFAPIFEVK